MASRKAQTRVLTLLVDNPYVLSGWDNRVLTSLSELGYVTSARVVDVRGGTNAARLWQITDAGRRAQTRWIAEATIKAVAA